MRGLRGGLAGLGLALGLLLGAPAPALADAPTAICTQVKTTQDGFTQYNCVPVSASAPLPVTSSATSTPAAAGPAVGAAAFTTGQWTNATASATQIVGARVGAPGVGRVSVTLYNSGSTTFFYGGVGVTTSTGTRLLPGGSRTIYTTAAIWGVPASGTSTADYDETF